METASRVSRRRLRSLGCGIVAALTAATACGGSGSGPQAGGTTRPAADSEGTPAAGAADPTVGTPRPGGGAVPSAPEGDAFWTPPDPLAPGQPGDLIWARPVPGAVAGGTTWLVLYRSTTEDGEATAVSGVVAVPTGPAPATPRPVLAVAHSTVGLADGCAPSRVLAAGGGGEVGGFAAAAMAQGWVLAATDYRGLGTPGPHPYLVGQRAGRDVLDIVRAVGHLPDTGADPSSSVLLVGHSQGGGASVFAAELAPGYAPELNVVGAVAGAPITEVARRASSWPPAPGQDTGFAMMAIAGFLGAYPGLDVASVLTAGGQAALPSVERGCVGDVLAAFAADDPAQLFALNGPDPAWRAALEANVAGQHATGVPLYVFHGAADAVVPAAWSADYQARACAAGSDVTRIVYPDLDHGSVVPAALGPAFAWLAARLAGQPPAPGCPGA